jgi:peroxiredoxin family protein
MAATKKKLSIVSFSGDFDKVIAVFTLATGAAAVGYEVNLFFTFWGLNTIKLKKGRAPLGKGILDRVFNFLMGGFGNLPLSRLMKKNNVATLAELVQAAKDLKVNFYACEMAMLILGVKKEDLIPEVKEVLGVAKFLENSEGGEVLFI